MEPTRSEAALLYVWKEDTRIPDTQFELGDPPLQRNNKQDWETIWDHAKKGHLDRIPGDVRIRCYNQLKRIGADHQVPRGRPGIQCYLYWGVSGSGKSHKAWTNAGDDCYAKDPRNKWWDGYRGQSCVVIDEFCGMIGIEHLLRWLDKYPVCVETKGGSTTLDATTFYLTSNKPVETWYPDATLEQIIALKRRLTIEEFTCMYIPDEEHDLFEL